MVDVQERTADLKATNDTEGRRHSARQRHMKWHEHMGRWQSSGLTQAEYCRRNELKLSTFHYWRKRLRQDTTAVTLVQVPVGFSDDRRRCHRSQGLTLILSNRYKVDIGDQFNASTLARLVDTLGRL